MSSITYTPPPATAATPALQPVLNAGNIADGSLPILFQNGATSATYAIDRVVIVDAAGSQSQMTTTNISTHDVNGNTGYITAPQDGTARTGAMSGNAAYEIVAAEINMVFLSYTQGVFGNTWTFNNSDALTKNTSFNWRSTGNLEEVAYLSDIVMGTPNLQQVLDNGSITLDSNITMNTSAGDTTVIQGQLTEYSDASGNDLQVTPVSILYNDGAGSSASLVVNGIQYTNVSGTNMFAGASNIGAACAVGTSTGTAFQINANQAGDFVEIKANDSAGNVFEILVNGSGSIYPFAASSANFKLTGNAETVAYLSNIITRYGTFSSAGFVGTTLLIPIAFTGATYGSVTAINIATASALGNGFYIAFTGTDMALHFAVSIVVAITVAVDWQAA